MFSPQFFEDSFYSVPIGLRVPSRDDLNAGGLVASVGHVAVQLLVGEGVSGVRPEGQLRREDGLALQPCLMNRWLKLP